STRTIYLLPLALALTVCRVVVRIDLVCPNANLLAKHGINMKLAILILIFSLAALSATFAADVTGTWKTEFDSPVGHQKYTYTLKQDGSKLTGKANAEIGDQKHETELSEGKIDD